VGLVGGLVPSAASLASPADGGKNPPSAPVAARSETSYALHSLAALIAESAAAIVAAHSPDDRSLGRVGN
jgi:hypothetical protein